MKSMYLIYLSDDYPELGNRVPWEQQLVGLNISISTVPNVISMKLFIMFVVALLVVWWVKYNTQIDTKMLASDWLL